MSAKIDPILPEARVRAMKQGGWWRGHTLLDYFEQHLAQKPRHPAIFDDNSMTGERTQLSYAGLSQRVDRIAAGLARLGVEPGDVVSFQLPNWWQFAALHLATMRLGAVSNPLVPIFRERELEFILRWSGSKVLVVPRLFRKCDHAAMAAGLQERLPELRHVLVVGGSGANAFEKLLEDGPGAGSLPGSYRRPGGDDVIQLLYTSGTTGEPKGVMHTSNTLFSNLEPYARRLQLGAGEVVLAASPLAHQIGFAYGMMLPLYLGGTAVMQDIWEPRRAAEMIQEHKATFTMASTPFLLDLTNEAEGRPENFRSLRIYVASGAPIPRSLARRAAEHLGAHIIAAWGMTENCSVTVTRLDDPPEKAFETDGCVLPGMQIRVVDLDNKPLPADETGRFQVRGCSNFVGYLKRPEWYATDSEGWFDTGDLARIDGDGYVRIAGRTKDVIIRGGENIPVVEIEGLIYQHPAVREAAIVAMPDPRLGERACAFVAANPGMSVSGPELLAFLESRHCARQYLPERFEVLPELPKTPSGKLQKFRLREMASRFKTNA